MSSPIRSTKGAKPAISPKVALTADQVQPPQPTNEAVGVDQLHPPSVSGTENNENSRFCVAGCFLRLNCFRTITDDLAPIPKANAFPPGKAPPMAKAKARAMAPAPPAMAKAKAKLTRRASCPAQQVWKGPAPQDGWKSQRVVNWSPIRHQGLLEGSVWQQVNNSIESRGHEILPPETLNKAFMRSVKTPERPVAKAPGAPPKLRKKKEKKEERRVWQPKEAFIADVMYAQLSKNGLADIQQLRWLADPTKKAGKEGENGEIPSSSSSSSGLGEYSDLCSSSDSSDTSDSESGSSEPEPEKEDVAGFTEESLETLLTFLRLAETKGVEDILQGGDNSQLPLAAPERLLHQLLTKCGPGPVLRSRVQATLIVTCFPKETEQLERTIRSGLHAAGAVVSSTAIPIFLEGVLLLGNYVNSSSQALGSATGVTLDSLAKLAHTRSLDSAPVRTPGKQAPKTALDLLISQLQETQGPTWLITLRSELQCCQQACDLDVSATSSGLKELAGKLQTVEGCFPSLTNTSEESPSSIESRVKRFMTFATPRLDMLRGLEQELQAATTTMRKYFAEPPGTSLTSMLRSLASLSDLLPRPDPNLLEHTSQQEDIVSVPATEECTA